MARQTKKGITVHKTLHMKNAFVTAMAYTFRKKPVLTELVWSGYDGGGNFETGNLLRRRSTDNGRNWTVLPDAQAGGLFGRSEERRGNRLVKRSAGGGCLHFLAEPGVVIQFEVETESAISESMSFGPEAETQEHLEFRTGRIFYRLSRDDGKSWSEAKQVIQKGGDYDATHWANGLWYGKNGCFLTGLTLPIQLRDGALLAPVHYYRLDDKGAMIKWPDRFGTLIWPISAAACLRGEWNAARGDFEWEMSSPVTAPEYVTHGLDECEIAEADDGKLMMIIRGCAAGWQSFSGVKFYSISKDKGRTWGPPVPLTYPDGSFVHSPACLPNLFRSSKNGKLYVIANILPGPCRQSDPRYPLAIAEVDPKYYWVLPETVTVIDDRQPRHPQGVRFSNWQRIEDRETGNPVIFMTEMRYDSLFPDTKGTIIPHAYRYEIELPNA